MKKVMEQSNKLIAEFMGVDQVDIDYAFNEHGQLKYHLSWDWLMPVVNKCLNIYHIEQMNDDLNFKFYNSMGDIKKTYQVVVEFIKEQNDTGYKTCDKCSYDNLDDNGDVLEHYCEDDELYTPNN